MIGLGLVPLATGTFDDGIEFVRYGQGSRIALWLPGGPGSELPSGWAARLQGQQLRPLVDAGFSVWMISRRRHMPEGHTVADMAADCADLIAAEFAGRVELVVGHSYGGMIAQYLAADHPGTVDRVVLALSAGRITHWGRDVDERWAHARAAGRTRDAGEALAEYVLPEPGQRRQRQILATLLGPAFAHSDVPVGDLLVEARAERLFDATDALPRIGVPVLLISASRDRFFTPEIIDETMALIPDCTGVQYEQKGHIRASLGSGIARDSARFCAA